MSENNNHIKRFNDLISYFINLEDEEISLYTYYIKSDKNQDKIYESKEIYFCEEILDWYKTNIKKELESLRKDYGDGENINISEYNNEFSLTNYIPFINVNLEDEPQRSSQENLHDTYLKPSESTLKSKYDKLMDSLVVNEGHIESSKFSLVRMEDETEVLHIGFYKGIRKNTSKKKYCLGIMETDDYYPIDNNMIELGGKPSFIIWDEKIYIINSRNFEYAFYYTDYIMKKRDENLDKIGKMDFFDSKESSEQFIDSSKGYVWARSIAQISDEILNQFEDNFEERCDELKLIYTEMDKDVDIEETLDRSDNIILELREFIDLEKKKIRFDKESNPTVLLHFFQDKIMTSFLTKKISVAIKI